MEPVKIICIDDTGRHGKHPFLEIGDIYEPIGEGLTVDGIPGWVLPGLPPTSSFRTKRMNPCAIYSKARFVVLPGLSADEMAAIEKEAIIR